MSVWPTVFLLLSCTVCALTLYALRRPRVKVGLPYPPGPARLPLLGNVHLLPVKYQEQTFTEWGRHFGL